MGREVEGEACWWAGPGRLPEEEVEEEEEEQRAGRVVWAEGAWPRGEEQNACWRESARVGRRRRRADGGRQSPPKWACSTAA